MPTEFSFPEKCQGERLLKGNLMEGLFFYGEGYLLTLLLKRYVPIRKKCQRWQIPTHFILSNGALIGQMTRRPYTGSQFISRNASDSDDFPENSFNRVLAPS
jgi:hypothetical protein